MAYLRVNQDPNNRWRGDFTMQKNHIFGTDGPGVAGWLVTACRPGRRRNTIDVYRCRFTPDRWIWYHTDVPVTSELGQAILEKAKERSSDHIEYKPLARQEVHFRQQLTSSVYDEVKNAKRPYITGGAFTPVRYNQNAAAAAIAARATKSKECVR